MAAWHEASGADPEYLPTDRPSAVSENGGDKSRLRKRTCRQRYQGMVGSLVRPRKHPLMVDMEVIVRRQNHEHCASITCMIRHYVARRAKVIFDHPHNAAKRSP